MQSTSDQPMVMVFEPSVAKALDISAAVLDMPNAHEAVIFAVGQLFQSIARENDLAKDALANLGVRLVNN